MTNRPTTEQPLTDGPRVCAALGLPTFVLDTHGTIVAANDPLVDLIGDQVGRSYLDVIPPQLRIVARARFQRRLVSAATMERLLLIARDGRAVDVVVRLAPFPVAGAGLLGVVLPLPRARSCAEANQTLEALTPRQEHVLGLLAEGLDTATIATELGVASETARNHIRRVLGRLGAHSRLEAVAVAYRHGLLDVNRHADGE